MAIWTPQHRPSWKGGFAKYPAEARYPGLWKGLVGAWLPSLGPTGLTLFNIATQCKRNNGMLTSMDPATDWVIDSKGYSLYFDAIDNNAVIFPVVSLGTIYSAFMWLRVGDLGNRIPASNSLDAGSFIFQKYGGDLYHKAGNSSGVSSGGFWEANTWQHWGVTRAGTTAVTVWKNGTVSGMLTLSANQAFALDRLGQYKETTTYRWLGEIGDMLLYNRVLLPSEIKLLYEYPDALVMQRQRVYPAAVAAPPGDETWRSNLLLLIA